MAVTLADLVAEVEDFLSSHGADRDKTCTLAGGGISPSALTFTVDAAAQVDRGLVEIDYELIAVDSKNNGTNVVTVPAWGRGQRGTTAAVHSAGARVAVNPKFPRSRIRTEINTAIGNLFPDLFAVATDETNLASPAVVTYPLPATAEGVLKVSSQAVGPSKTWKPVRAARFDYTASTTDFPTGRSIDVLSATYPGRPIQVVYMKKFTDLVLDSDTLASVGADDSWRDLIVLQVCAKLILGLDPSRLQTTTMEQQNRSTSVPVGSASSISRQLSVLQQSRVLQERSLLLQRYPTRIMHSN